MEPARALPDFDAHPISDESKRKILWDNAVKLYGQRLISWKVNVTVLILSKNLER
jgi:hypothetical protein